MSNPNDKSHTRRPASPGITQTAVHSLEVLGAPAGESAAAKEMAPEGQGPNQPTTPYVVLARKYRPQTFDDLIGQDVMVRTLRNAFAMERIAQAYMLTGVRGVGKTTTARILARALNYELPGVLEKPSLDMPQPGVHCQAIMASRHVDVLEMDAASNTGIDDIREIIEAVRYKPASARYRVFIIDEVHMLSKSAFNGLLKTLEEPPPHVKFIFATTEIRKVPVTILSRCQRFDLRRVEPELLAQHFNRILSAEGHSADDAALALLARAAEGSVRDGLSLLDQALTLGHGHLTAALVLEMLGLAGRGAVFDLLERLFRGDPAVALASLNALHDSGGDPVMILTDLADAVHAVSRLKAVPGVYPPDFSAEDRATADKLAAALPVPRLALAWQMLLKGLDEVARAPRPFAAAEMLIIRMCYTAALPSPAEVIDTLNGKRIPSAGSRDGGHSPASDTRRDSVSSRQNLIVESRAVEAEQDAPSPEVKAAPSALAFTSFESIAAHATEIRDIKLKVALEEQVELVQFGPGFLELHLLEAAPRNLAQDLSKKLQAWTGERWIVSLSEKRGRPPLGQQRREDAERAVEEMKRHPAVKRVMHHFPEAQIKSVRTLEK
jgi:DNA polymerase-3 subunit gamma/tau